MFRQRFSINPELVERVKMKKLIILLALLTTCYLLLTTTSNAQTPTTTPDTRKIKDQLIESIASRVAELNLVEKRGIIGTVIDVSNTQITLSDTKNNTRFIDVDELTKFSSANAKGSFGISDITNGVALSALGLYNKESRRLLARFINVVTLPWFIHGEVGEIDRTNRVFDIVDKNGEITKIDFVNSTRILSYTKNDNLTKSLFSAIQEHSRIVVVGSPDSKIKDLITAERIILLPEIPSVLKLNETTTSSTESGEKVMPTTR